MALAGRRDAEPMPTKRTKIPPARINDPVPAWVERLKAGEPPPRDSEAHQELIGWFFFRDVLVPGLPDPDTAEGRALWRVCVAD